MPEAQSHATQQRMVRDISNEAEAHPYESSKHVGLVLVAMGPLVVAPLVGLALHATMVTCRDGVTASFAEAAKRVRRLPVRMLSL